MDYLILSATYALNPNPYLGWLLVMGPLLLRAWRQAPVIGVTVVATFYLTMVLATAVIVLLAGGARAFGPRAARTLVGLSAVALGCFGLYQLWSGSAALVHRSQPPA